MISFNNYLVVIFREKGRLSERRIDSPREGLTWNLLDAHRRKLPESPADQNSVEHQRKFRLLCALDGSMRLLTFLRRPFLHGLEGTAATFSLLE